jgi:multimeric flavodoxin WrbA
MRVLVIHTSTHAVELSSSAALARAAAQRMQDVVPGAEFRLIDASKLHIVHNLSCYANGMSHCADPAAGPYRCWAQHLSAKTPAKFGGVDQMPVIYDGLQWADVVIFSTSTRWGSHSALCQKIIERMNNLENRAVAYGEPYPMLGKRLGVVCTGVDWRTDRAASNLLDALRWWGFATMPGMDCALYWQRSMDPYFEQPDNSKPYLERWTLTRNGRHAIDAFVRNVLAADTTTVV